MHILSTGKSYVSHREVLFSSPGNFTRFCADAGKYREVDFRYREENISTSGGTMEHNDCAALCRFRQKNFRRMKLTPLQLVNKASLMQNARPETEELVELILQQFDINQQIKFLEIGCGTGCISLALLHSLPKATGWAVDQSQVACKLTIENAKTHKLEKRLQVVCHKLTEDSLLDEIEEGFDLIVSNPPYVLNRGLLELEPEIKLYEDLRALDGGADGLTIIKNLLRVASRKLRKKGCLWLEVDPSHPDLIQKYLPRKHQRFAVEICCQLQRYVPERSICGNNKVVGHLEV